MRRALNTNEVDFAPSGYATHQTTEKVILSASRAAPGGYTTQNSPGKVVSSGFFFWVRRGGGISRKTVIALISVADGGGVGNQISLRSSEMSTNQSESRLVCRGWVPASINFRK